MSDRIDRLASPFIQLGATASRACVLFGGWGEELSGLRPAGPHKDIDVLLLASGFDSLEWAMGGREEFREIRAKRFAHKRAWTTRDGLMLEFLLVERDVIGPLTRFWGDLPYRWLDPLSDRVIELATTPLAVASRANLGLGHESGLSVRLVGTNPESRRPAARACRAGA